MPMPAISVPVPTCRKTLDRLRTLCEEVGRDFGQIVKTCPWRFDVGANGPDIPALLEQLRGFAELGIDMVVGRVVDDYRITPIEVMGRRLSRPSQSSSQTSKGSKMMTDKNTKLVSELTKFERNGPMPRCGATDRRSTPS